MAWEVSVASLFNRLADMAYLAVLSLHNKAFMTELVTDYFSNDPDTEMSDSEEEELGKLTL